MKKMIALSLMAVLLAGCTGIRVYDGNGNRLPGKGIQVKEVEPWFAVYPSGEVKVVQVPTGNEREIIPYNILSRSKVSLEINDAGSLQKFGIESDSAGMADALQSVLKSSAREMASDESNISVIFIRAKSFNGGPLERVYVYSSGKMIRKID